MRAHAATGLPLLRPLLRPVVLLLFLLASSSALGFVQQHRSGSPPPRPILRAAHRHTPVRVPTAPQLAPTTTTMAAAGGAGIHASLAGSMTAGETRIELTEGLVVAAKVWGPVDGVPVLGLHGWLDNCATFDRMGPHLAAAGIRLISIDFPGACSLLSCVCACV